MESFEDDEPDFGDWDAVAAYVERMCPPEEVEIQLDFVKGMVALQRYLEAASG